jgi:hypothetical protein
LQDVLESKEVLKDFAAVPSLPRPWGQEHYYRISTVWSCTVVNKPHHVLQLVKNSQKVSPQLTLRYLTISYGTYLLILIV